MFKIRPKDKFFLFKQNPVFCTAPWSLMYVYPDGAVRTCVAGTERTGNLLHDSMDEILISGKRREIRQQILLGKQSQNCSRCIKLENDGDGNTQYQFLRNNYNELCRDLDIDYHDDTEFVLGALDLHWSSICNLKCVTCWAKQSSSIAKEQGEPVLHLPQDRAHEFIDWIVANQSTLRELYLSGGEPMLIKYNRRLLSRLQPRHDLQIRVNSNLMWKQDNSVLHEVLRFPNTLFTCSADNVGAKFDYIRRDADWSVFLDNLHYLQKQPTVRLRINMVFFVLSALDLTDTIDYFVTDHGISDITINQCGMGQTHLRARNLSRDLKQTCTQQLLNVMDRYSNNLNLVGQLKNCLTELEQPEDQCYRDHFDRVDLMAGTDWRALFPEIA